MKWNLKNARPHTQLEVVTNKPGESIEEKLRRVLATGEPVDSIAPLNYTERKDGVLAEYDHRADKMELAQDAAQKYYNSRKAGFEKREKAAAEAERKKAEAAKAAEAAKLQPVGEA